jgi:hypothetical protein
MKNLFARLAFAATLGSLLISIKPVFAQGTAFTYQGQLTSGGSPANGNYDFTFALFNTNNTSGGQVGGTITQTNLGVTNGLFSTTLDFGAVFAGDATWLAIEVRTNGGSTFTALNPLQPLTPTPYAIYASGAGSAASANAVAGSNIVGTVPLAQLPAGLVTNTETGVALSGTFSGNGANVTNVNAVSLNGLKATNFWQLGGNFGTTPGVNYVGTADNQPLEMHVNGMRGLRLEFGGVSSTIGGSIPNGAPNVVGGSPVNFVTPGTVGCFIGGGGATNYNGSALAHSIGAYSDFSVIGGGVLNTIQASSGESTIGGGAGNIIQASSVESTIGGGGGNIIQASSVESTIGGGAGNIIQTNSPYSFIGGGGGNVAANEYATVSGGDYNTNLANGGTIAGGQNNAVGNYDQPTVGGGNENAADGSYATVGGGLFNLASGNYTTVVGGNANEALAIGAFVGGGGDDGVSAINANIAYGGGSVVVGGVNNAAGGLDSIIGGGFGNTVDESFSTVGGGYYNQILNNSPYSFIGGGLNNVASGDENNFGTLVIVGGDANVIASNSWNSAIVGGEANQIGLSSHHSFIGGGLGNQSANGYGTVGGGNSNTNLGFAGTIAGGQNNVAGNNFQPAVGGGFGNQAAGHYATVPGGFKNLASGEYSFAAGDQAQATKQGSFAWGDSSGATTTTFANNQFMARASGGFVFLTGTGASPTAYGSGTAGAALAANGTSWSTISDRNAKKNFAPVDTKAVLDKLAGIPIQQWNYKWEKDGDVPNIGPMAQDFKGAFYPGRDDKSITTLEFDGVELAAIQGLNQKLDETRAESQSQDAEIAALKEKAGKVDLLEKRLADLEQTVQALAGKK